MGRTTSITLRPTSARTKAPLTRHGSSHASPAATLASALPVSLQAHSSMRVMLYAHLAVDSSRTHLGVDSREPSLGCRLYAVTVRRCVSPVCSRGRGTPPLLHSSFLVSLCSHSAERPLCSTLYAHLPKSIWGPGKRMRAELAHPSSRRGPVAPRTRKFGAGGCAAATVSCAGARLRSFWRGCHHATTPSLSLSLLSLSRCSLSLASAAAVNMLHLLYSIFYLSVCAC